MPTNLAADIADIVLMSTSQDVFRYALMERLCSTLALDYASMNSTNDGHTIVLHHAQGVCESRLRPQMSRYMGEMNSAELQRASAGCWSRDTEVFTRARRERLSLYNEYLSPYAMPEFVARMWIHRGVCFWFTCARSGVSSRLGARELAMLDDIFSLIAIGEALHCAQRPAEIADDSLPYLLKAHKVTSAETGVVKLVQRGLTNKEVATVLGTSINTIRNQLSSVFQKLGVSNRTGLLFAIASLGDASQMARPVGENPLRRLIEGAALPSTVAPRRV